MRFGPRRFARTCTLCGERWEVTARQARSGAPRMGRPRRAGAGAGAALDVRAGVSRHADALEVWAGYRRCPRCGVDSFSQAPARRREPRASGA